MTINTTNEPIIRMKSERKQNYHKLPVTGENFKNRADGMRKSAERKYFL